MNHLTERYRPFGQQASAYITFLACSDPAALYGSLALTINGTAFTYGTDFFGSSPAQAAISLCAAINADPSRLDLVSSSVAPALIRPYYAVFSGTRVLLIATAPGTGGNALTLTTSAAAFATVSGATFSGGVAGSSISSSSTISGSTLTPTTSANVTSGTIAAGTKQIIFIASSDFSGTILTNLPLVAGASFTLTAPVGSTIGAIAFTRSAGILYTVELR